MKQWKNLLGIFMSSAMLITGGVLPQKNVVAAEGVRITASVVPELKTE